MKTRFRLAVATLLVVAAACTIQPGGIYAGSGLGLEVMTGPDTRATARLQLRALPTAEKPADRSANAAASESRETPNANLRWRDYEHFADYMRKQGDGKELTDEELFGLYLEFLKWKADVTGGE